MHGPRPSTTEVVLVTGASSGIGRELALAWARPGAVLHLCARRPEELAETAAQCRARGAKVETRVIDVTDRAAMESWIAAIDAETPIDVVVANAGIYGGLNGCDGEDAAQARAIFDINLGGTLNTVLPVLPGMRRRGRGRIVLISSLAGFRGQPVMPAYSASKAAVRVWGEALRGWLAAEGVTVTVVCPGHVRTAMCGIVDASVEVVPADQAAQLIRAAALDGRPRLAFPLRPYLRALASAMLPPAWREKLRGHPLP
jgi:short-subunit dehydrogenase